MPIFLVDIPPGDGKPSGLKARVEAASWMVALAVGLERLGFPRDAGRDVSADIRDDGTILVTDRTSRRVFRIREVRRHTTRADAPRAKEKPLVIEPLAPLPKNAPAVAWKEYGKTGSQAPRRVRTHPPEGASASEVVTLPPELSTSITVNVRRACWAGFGVKALDQLLHLALEHITAESGSVYLVDPRDGTLRICAAWGPRARRILERGVELKKGAGVAGFCVDKGVTLALSDVERDPRFHAGVAKDLDYPVRSLLTAPIQVKTRAVACLQLLNRKGAPTFSPLDAAALTLLVKEAGERFALAPVKKG